MSALLEHLQDLKTFRDKRDTPEYQAMVWATVGAHLDELIELVRTGNNLARECADARQMARDAQGEIDALKDAIDSYRRLLNSAAQTYAAHNYEAPVLRTDGAVTHTLQGGEYERMEQYRIQKEARPSKDVLDAIVRGRETGYVLALEVAAKVCDAEWQGTSSLCRSKCAGDLAKRIRALKDPEASGTPRDGVTGRRDGHGSPD